MKKMFFAAFPLLLLIAGCSVKKPGIVLNEFLDAAQKKDFAAARSLVTADSKLSLSMLEKQSTGTESNKALEKFDKSKMEMGEPVVHGDSCMIPAKLKEENGMTLNFPLKKESGEWRVDLNGFMAANQKLIDDMINQLMGGVGDIGNKIDSLGLDDNVKGKIKDALDKTKPGIPKTNEDSIYKANKSAMDKLMEMKKKQEPQQ